MHYKCGKYDANMQRNRSIPICASIYIDSYKLIKYAPICVINLHYVLKKKF